MRFTVEMYEDLTGNPENRKTYHIVCDDVLKAVNRANSLFLRKYGGFVYQISRSFEDCETELRVFDRINGYLFPIPAINRARTREELYKMLEDTKPAYEVPYRARF